LFPYQGFLLAFDWARLRPNHVMGIARSSVTLATLSIRRPARLMLDLGTGCGLHALLATPYHERILAVDRNPRAINIATFNARLNRANQVECRTGDLFAPVEDQAFDLIVANLPFVISPESRYWFRDGGMPSDHFCQMIVREVPRRLQEGGYCQLLCNWAHIVGQDWQERLRQWFTGSGCDVWVMQADTHDAAAYATTWIQDSEEESATQFAAHFDAWMAYYRRERIEAISLGLITMRRATHHPNWLRIDGAPEIMHGSCGAAVLQGFAAYDFLATVRDDQALMQACLQVAPEVCWEQKYAPAAGGWRLAEGHLALTQGLAYKGTIDPIGVRVVIGCDGKRSLHNVLREVAAALGGDVERIATVCLPVVRHLIAQGFLLPVGVENHA
jgi:SAM-dependent methyltransferase